jgi:hypothetical protein
VLEALVVGAGTQPGMVAIGGGIPLLALLTAVIVFWRGNAGRGCAGCSRR